MNITHTQIKGHGLTKAFFILLLFGQVHSSFSQFNCASHEVFQQQMANDAQFKINQQNLETETQNYLMSGGNHKAAAAVYIIPVVFHVIHTGGSGNISNAQIIDQVEILNKEFKRQQADTTLTPTAFKPFAAPFNVEFRLATLDPSGNCTNGINRVYSTLSNCSVNENDVKALSYWPSNQYLNIWITQEMHYSGSTDCSGGGYATFPGALPNIDGINIRGDLIGKIGTAITNTGWGNFLGRYLIHELGHWFNLRHIWGDAICGDDQIADTPPANNSNSGCPSFPRNPNNICGANANGEMFNNYMDYTNGPCLNMFTAQQVARMTVAINSTVSGRNNLWTNSNLIATGTSDPYSYPVGCASSPEVLPYGPIIACVGDSVQLTDLSYGGNVTSRFWDFYGGSPSSVTDSIVKVKYNSRGVYSFALSNYYLASTTTNTFLNKVVVLGKGPDTFYWVPFIDELEDPSMFEADWTIVDCDNDSSSWVQTGQTSYSGVMCAGIFNFNKKGPVTDVLITPAYDLRAVENPTLNFMLHFANRNTVNYDKLQVFISKDCSTTWTSIYLKDAQNSLKTVPQKYTVSHIPAVASGEWRKETVNLLPFLADGIVRFKFSFTSGGGNNIFIDDINVDGINYTGLKTFSKAGNFKLFPNPTTDKLNISYDLAGDNVQISIVDLFGRKIVEYNPEQQKAGNNNHATIATDGLVNGVYFVHVKQNMETIYLSKFVKQGAE